MACCRCHQLQKDPKGCSFKPSLRTSPVTHQCQQQAVMIRWRSIDSSLQLYSLQNRHVVNSNKMIHFRDRPSALWPRKMLLSHGRKGLISFSDRCGMVQDHHLQTCRNQQNLSLVLELALSITAVPSLNMSMHTMIEF